MSCNTFCPDFSFLTDVRIPIEAPLNFNRNSSEFGSEPGSNLMGINKDNNSSYKTVSGIAEDCTVSGCFFGSKFGSSQVHDEGKMALFFHLIPVDVLF
jgi:hypothetical protein